MTETVLNSDTQLLVELFKNVKNVELIPWEKNADAVGISVLKDYPKNGDFIPIRTPSGANDSVAMIRIWYLYSGVQKNSKKKKAILNIEVRKSSRYIFKHHFYKDLDPNSPQKDAIDKSNASLQPVDVELTKRFELNLDNGKIIDLKEKKYIRPSILVELAFDLHIKTSRNVAYRFKVSVQRIIIDLIDPINTFLKNINLYLFGKRIRKNTDFAAGIITPYKYQDLEDLTLATDKIKILGTEIPISPRSAVTFIAFFSLLYIIHYSFKVDILGIVTLFQNINNNFFLAILSAGVILAFDRALPIMILYIINLLIRLKWYLVTLKINI